jgi:hypothetical protein
MPAWPVMETRRARPSRDVAWKRSLRSRSSVSRPTNGRLEAGGAIGAAALRDHADGAPGGNRRLLALEDLVAGFLEEDRRSGGLAGRLADEDRAGRRDGLQAAGGVHEVAGDEPLVRRPDRDGSLPGQDPGPQAELDAGVAPEVADAADELEAGPDGPLGIVLAGDRRAPHRHDGVADELLDRAAVPLDRLAARLEVAGEQLADRLRVAAGGEGGEPDEVGEEDGDVPALR